MVYDQGSKDSTGSEVVVVVVGGRPAAGLAGPLAVAAAKVLQMNLAMSLFTFTSPSCNDENLSRD